MKDIVIFGASGMGKEVAWLLENINRDKRTWNIIGFVDDDERYKEFNSILRYKYLGTSDWFKEYNKEVYVSVAIGKSKIRKKVYERLLLFPNVKCATLVDPSVKVDETICIGEGSIICRNCTVTVDTKIGNGVLMNTGSSVGHDSEIDKYCTLLTNSIVAGHTKLGEGCEIGSGAFILQGKTLVANTIIAPLTSVLTDITESGTYIGNPARRMR